SRVSRTTCALQEPYRRTTTLLRCAGVIRITIWRRAVSGTLLCNDLVIKSMASHHIFDYGCRSHFLFNDGVEFLIFALDLLITFFGMALTETPICTYVRKMYLWN
ncbi:unnamed protein product, partial [Ectocarpus fasciculatus]